MLKTDSYIVNGMLASYLEEEKWDYMSLLRPFLLKSLPLEKDAEIDINNIQDRLKKEFSLDIPSNVVQSLLSSCCKEKNGAYVRKKGNEYFINKCYESEDFDRKKMQIKQSMDLVTNELISFINNKKNITNITESQAREYLITFLDTYNYSLLQDPTMTGLIAITDKQVKTNFLVGQFILEESKKESTVMDYLSELVRGTLASKSIYFFMKDDSSSGKKKIKGTSFYFDTTLLIDALSLNLECEAQATAELIKLITENGGIVKTFTHYVEELEGIIYKYAIDPKSRMALDLDRFLREGKSTVEVKAYLDTLEDRLVELGIVIEDTPNYEEAAYKKDYLLDYGELRNAFVAEIEYRDKDGERKSLESDVSTIEAIAYLRGIPRKCNVFNCKAIFVTENVEIIKVVYKLYRNERFSNHEINFAISDVDLTAMLWLNTFGKQKDLPKQKLMENAYAACAPSKRVLNAFLCKIDQMEESENITRETALVLRTQRSSIDDLVELTDNSEKHVNDDVIREMEARIKNRIKKEVKTDLSSEFVALDKEKEIQEHEREEIEEARKDLIASVKRNTKLKQDNAIIEKRLESQRVKNEADRQKNDQFRKKAETFQKEIVKDIEKKAKIFSRLLCVVCIIILSILSIGIAGTFIYATIWSMRNEQIHNFFTILICVISIGGGISLIFAIWKWGYKGINKLSSFIYDKTYKCEVEKKKGYFIDL